MDQNGLKSKHKEEFVLSILEVELYETLVNNKRITHKGILASRASLLRNQLEGITLSFFNLVVFLSLLKHPAVVFSWQNKVLKFF